LGLRCELQIGLSALSVLSRGQLEALVAHELAPLRYRNAGLVLRLRSIYESDRKAPDTQAVRREGTLFRLANFWSTVDSDADAAAIRFGGVGNAAAAVATVALGAGANVRYSFNQRPPDGHSGIQDLDDGWRRTLAHHSFTTDDGKDWDTQASEHTTLAAAIQEVGAVRLRLADDRVELVQLSEHDQRELAQRSLLLVSPFILWRVRRIRWYTFAAAPPQWWIARAEFGVEFVRNELEIPAEADLLEALDDTDEGVEALKMYAELQLLKGGWRLESPAVRGVLLSPAGQRIDLATMDREAVISVISSPHWAVQ
jgi:hypothetical protein